MTSPASPVWAILPIKSLHSAKQRLSKMLSPDERRELMLNSARDVLAALSNCRRLSGILLVSKDASALALGREFGVQALRVTSDDGHSDAIDQAIIHLQKQNVSATVTIPADTPLLTARDVDTVCDSLRNSPSVVLVSNSDGTGTNCIGASPPNLISYQFGSDSFSRHVLAARDAGVQPTILKLPSFELDIDTESDVSALMKKQISTATQKYLHASALALESR